MDVPIEEAEARFDEILARVEAGEEVFLTRDGVRAVVFRLAFEA